MSFLEEAKIAVVGDPLKSESTSSVSTMIQEVVRCTMSHGILSADSSNDDYDILEIGGSPWKCFFETAESGQTRLLVARILEQMLARGWMVCAHVFERIH